MSVRTMARVWEQSQHAGSELLMLLAIADFSDDDGRAYPAVLTLANKCRMTSRNANMILANLRKSGELAIGQNEGPKGTNLYQIRFPPPEARFTPEEVFTLKPSSPTPEAGFPKPLKPASDEPSVNHQEPSTKRDDRSPKGSRLSADWILPNEFREWATAEFGWTTERCVEIAERFRDHWISQPGNKGVSANWTATWRNWCRREWPNKPASAQKQEFSKIDYHSGVSNDGLF